MAGKQGKNPQGTQTSGSLPMASAEDVEFSEALADEDDLEARQRAEEADRRAASYEGD
ncbi:YfhD family protein [Cohnella caldifontis]|uniref:YfhD family protein n=1 Tax=Cohnella caldifontis TaxID=3027471 RepID=UPI0023ED0521|nr:YfhD family protein [Cohnella sp. YIM B05605]